MRQKGATRYSDREVFVLFMLTLSQMTFITAIPRNGTHYCFEVAGDPDSVDIYFQINQNDDALFEVHAFDTTTLDTSTPDNRISTPECTQDGSTDPVVYNFTITTTDATHACGATVYNDSGVTVVMMLFRAFAYSTTILDVDDDTYLIRCRMDDLNGAEVSTTTVEFGPDEIITVVQPQVGVYLRVLDSITKMPLHITTLGQGAILSVECLTEPSIGPDNMGTHFFVGFLGNDPISSISSSSLYIVIQPRYILPTDVTITTMFDGIEQMQLAIDDGLSRIIDFSPDFMGCSTDGVYEVADIGIEINSDHMEIGVLVCNMESGSADCYTAQPSDVAGTNFWASSMMAKNETSEILVVAHEDNTELSIEVPIDSTHPNAGQTLLVPLNKLQAFHYGVRTLDADTSHVNGYHITSNNPISVFSGNTKYSNDHLSIQVPPVEKFGDHYVLVSVDFLGDGRLTKYIIQAVQEGVDTIVTQYLADYSVQEYNITTTTYPPQVIEVASGSPCELIADQPIMVSQITEPFSGKGFESSLLVMPSVDKWAPSYSFNFNDSAYLVTAISVFQSNNDIKQYKVNGFSITPTSTATVAGPSGYVFAQGISLSASQHYTLAMDDGITPVMVLCYASAGGTIQDSDVGIAFDPYGTRLADFGQCEPVGRRGDGVDNDCDGRTDEDKVNKIDDDLDGEIDEDPPSIRTESSVEGVVAVRPVNCKVSGDATFPADRTLAITDADGCIVAGGGSFKAASDFVPAADSTDVRQVLQGGAFKMGMFVGPPAVYFTCEIEKYCTSSDDPDCSIICSRNSRKKRDISEGYPTNISAEVWVFPYNMDKRQTNVKVTYRAASIEHCMDNTYILAMLSFLSAVSLVSLFTAICFCCLLRRRQNREKKRKRFRYLDVFRKQSF